MDIYRKQFQISTTDLSSSDVSKFDDLVQRCWKDSNTSVGYDAGGMTHARIKVRRVQRLVNKNKKQAYLTKRGRYLERVGDFIKPPIAREYLDGLLTRHFSAPGEGNLETRVFETFLFHGTKTSNVDGLHRNGFDMSKASGGLYGKWIYLADSSQKADQYTGTQTVKFSTAAAPPPLTTVLLLLFLFLFLLLLLLCIIITSDIVCAL